LAGTGRRPAAGGTKIPDIHECHERQARHPDSTAFQLPLDLGATPAKLLLPFSSRKIPESVSHMNYEIHSGRTQLPPSLPEGFTDSPLVPVPGNRVTHPLGYRDPQSMFWSPIGKVEQDESPPDDLPPPIIDATVLGRFAHPDRGGEPVVVISQTARRFRPFRRRLLITALPAGVRIRTRKPWVRCRLRLFGWKVLFISVFPRRNHSLFVQTPNYIDSVELCQREVAGGGQVPSGWCKFFLGSPFHLWYPSLRKGCQPLSKSSG